jgi:hypothetical protein
VRAERQALPASCGLAYVKFRFSLKNHKQTFAITQQADIYQSKRQFNRKRGFFLSFNKT